MQGSRSAPAELLNRNAVNVRVIGATSFLCGTHVATREKGEVGLVIGAVLRFPGGRGSGGSSLNPLRARLPFRSCTMSTLMVNTLRRVTGPRMKPSRGTHRAGVDVAVVDQLMLVYVLLDIRGHAVVGLRGWILETELS